MIIKFEFQLPPQKNYHKLAEPKKANIDQSQISNNSQEILLMIIFVCLQLNNNH